ncbi:MAG: hypothetical protein RL477_280 [Pseudomonadota bacterium]|jgi:hypothetical protein
MLKNLPKILISAAGALAVGVLASGCAVQTDKEQDYPKYGSEKRHREVMERLDGGSDTLFGELSIGGPKKQTDNAGGGAAVNLFLWRAALETLALGPLESADPFGGVIITDWFTLDEEPGSQFRVTAYILGRSLRTDNIKIAMYVRRNEDGKLMTRRATATAETRLENVILTKSRTIRATEYR